MKRGEVAGAVLAIAIAAILVRTGVTRLPNSQPAPFRHPPVVVYSDVMLRPLVVEAKRALPKLPHIRKAFERAIAGEKVRVEVTQYCLKGTTRRDHEVREGIVAADPRVFPLARYVEIFIGKHHLGRFLVDDTGSKVKGATLDIWTPSCSDARRFGRRRGTATLVARPEG